jgi:hypothetical protein
MRNTHIHTNIFYPVNDPKSNDPKSIEGNINNLDLEDKRKIYSRAFQDYFIRNPYRLLDWTVQVIIG